MYTCHVTNKLGGSTCALLVSEAILHAEVLDPLLIFIISILLAMLVVVLLAVLCYLCCRKRKDYSVGKYTSGSFPKVSISKLSFSVDFKEDHSKSALVNDGQNHADQDFYDNLPFNKLRNPPKHVISIQYLLEF